jgi:hypothetical protein
MREKECRIRECSRKRVPERMREHEKESAGGREWKSKRKNE